MIYELYVCKKCMNIKPNLSKLNAYGSKNKLTWCNDCQKETLGKWIKVSQ